MTQNRYWAWGIATAVAATCLHGIAYGLADTPAASQPASAPSSQPTTRYTAPPVAKTPEGGVGSAVAPDNLDALLGIQSHVQKTLPKIMPCVVGITVGAAQGSGVIVSPDGYILTAGHVANDTTFQPEAQLSCTLILSDGRRVKGVTLGANHIIDSGMIKITDPAPPGGWPYVAVGTSNDLRLGQWTIAIGHPGGYRVGRPPVVRLGRVTANVFGQVATVTTDNTLVGGDSGGPLFDLDGRLIGINSRIGQSTSDNMHAPVDTYVENWDELARGKVTHSRNFGQQRALQMPVVLGIGIDEMENGRGLRLSRVDPGSPADKAGLRTGDEIFTVNGRPIRVSVELQTILMQQKPGNVINVQIRRPDAEDQMLRVRLAAPKSQSQGR